MKIRENWKRIISLFLVIVIMSGSMLFPTKVMATDIVLESNDNVSNKKFSEKEQKLNAINMLNYIVALTEEIQKSSGSKLYMEEIFNSLINNTHPNAVDSLTLNEVTSLLESIKQFRMVDVNRERVEYVLQKDKAQALRDAVPDPIALLSISRTKNPLKIAASLAYMAIDAKTGYDTASADADMKYMEKIWELDDEAYTILANSTSDLFRYMVTMVGANDLDGDLSLTPEVVEDFVTWKSKSNVTSKIQHFENAANDIPAYKHFGLYWLEMAECYFENEDYQKCLDSIDQYEALNIHIFRRDYDYAKVLPKGIVAAKEVLPNSAYINKANEYCSAILDNSKVTDWASRYFVSEVYMTLYSDTKDQKYLKLAYDIVAENVNNLVDEQKELNKAYEKEVVERKAGKTDSKEQKKEIESYNKMLKTVRKTELVPISEPLLLNCELLRVIADKREIDKKEKERLDKIIHSDGEALFLNPSIDNLFVFSSTVSDVKEEDIEIEFNGKEIALPAMYLTSDSVIKMSVSGKDAADDWKIEKVNRKKGKPVDTFTAFYKSKKATKEKYNGGETIEITITPSKSVDTQPLKFNYQVKKEKRVGFLDKWQWLDHASEWSDDIRFERVTN